MKKSLLFISTLFAAGTLGAVADTTLGTETYSGTIYTITTGGTETDSSGTVIALSLKDQTLLSGVDSSANTYTGTADASTALTSDTTGAATSLNVLRFVKSGTYTNSSYSTTVTAGKILLDVSNLALSGLIVDEGATGWSIFNTANPIVTTTEGSDGTTTTTRTTVSDGTNIVNLGSSAIKFIGTINESFEICPSVGSGNYYRGNIHFYGEQEWTIATGKTLKLSGNWTVASGANVSFMGGGSTSLVTMTGDGGTATISGTLNISSGTLELWHLVGSGTINIGKNGIFNAGSFGTSSESWAGSIVLKDSTSVLNLPSISSTTSDLTVYGVTGTTGTINISSSSHNGLKLVVSSTDSSASDFTGTVVWTGKFNPNRTTLNSGATIELHSAADSTSSMWTQAAKSFDYAVKFATDYRIGDTDTSGLITLNGTISANDDVTVAIGTTRTNYSASATFTGTLNLGNATISTKTSTLGLATAGTISISGTASGTIKNLNSGGTTEISRTSSTTGTLSIENLNVSAGKTTVYLNNIKDLSTNPINISNVSVASGATFVLSATKATDILYFSNNSKFNTMTINGGGTVKLLTVDLPDTIGNLKTLQIDTLTISNATTSAAVISTQGDSSYNKAPAGWTVDKLTGSGTLQFVAAATTGAAATCGVLNIGGKVGTSSTADAAQSITASTNISDFAGTLEVTCASDTTAAGAAVVLYTSLANAKVSLLTSKSHLAVANNATIAGLSSASDATGATVYSGTARSDKTSDYLEYDTSAKTLTIETAKGNDYTYAGTIAGVAIAKTGAGTQTLSGAISDYGDAKSSVSVSAGTLTLSTANSYSGGTTIEGGTLVATDASALGAGTVTIDGGQLKIGTDSAVELSVSAMTIILDSYAGDSSAMAAILGNSASSVSSSDTIALSIVSSNATEYHLVDSALAGRFSDASFTLSDEMTNAGWGISSYDTTTGVITLTIPEPSMFGLLAGTLALGLAGTRRRRGNAK